MVGRENNVAHQGQPADSHVGEAQHLEEKAGRLGRQETEDERSPCRWREVKGGGREFRSGGVRDPRKAVANGKALRRTGHRIRNALELCVEEHDLKRFEHSVTVKPETVQQAVQVLREEFEVNEAEGYQTALLGAMLEAANDADAQVVPRWLVEGVPLGLSVPIEHTNVFPATDEVSAPEAIQ